MAMTQGELLGSIGAERLLGDDQNVFHAVAGDGIRITGEVHRGTMAEPVTALITYREASRVEPVEVCTFKAEPDGGRFTVTNFVLGGVSYGDHGNWSCFREVDACGFVRAVMLELEAERLPVFDDLLAIVDTPFVVDWGG